jgi:hypothetical protein
MIIMERLWEDWKKRKKIYDAEIWNNIKIKIKIEIQIKIEIEFESEFEIELER